MATFEGKGLEYGCYGESVCYRATGDSSYRRYIRNVGARVGLKQDSRLNDISKTVRTSPPCYVERITTDDIALLRANTSAWHKPFLVPICGGLSFRIMMSAKTNSPSMTWPVSVALTEARENLMNL